MSLPENAAPLLARTLAEGLLGSTAPGNMAFIRCLPAEAARELCADERFVIPGWRVAIVTDTRNDSVRAITADMAVEWREDKAEAVLLLVDIETAGAGMDGIYSAAREIGETELFERARSLAREKLPPGSKSFADRALSKARRLARNQSLSPWREFAYLCRASRGIAHLGAGLPEVGLWPVEIEDDRPDIEDLEKAARLVDRLMPRQGTRQTPEVRVAGLMLANRTQEEALASFLRNTAAMPRLTALAELSGKESLWLNCLKPGLFDAQILQRIRLVPWRGKNRKPMAWSGLQENDDERLIFRLPLEDKDNPQQRARLEVRWEATPTDLAKGAVDYAVEVRAGSDVLAEKTVSHATKAPQKCVFTADDFGELEESARYEAKVIVRALVATDESDAEEQDSPFRDGSEDFILCFGDTDAPAKASAGRSFPTLALAAIQVAKSAEQFDRLSSHPGDKQSISGPDAKGYISCRVDGKAARVLCPRLLLDLALDWGMRGGKPGRWRIKVRADGSPEDKPEFVPVPAISDDVGRRFEQASQDFSNWLGKSSLGPLAMLYTDRNKPLNEYVNTATAWWDAAPTDATLIHTLEVVSVSGRRVGLIVLPTHPLRVVWQQGFDMLVRRHRYEEGATAAKVEKLMGTLAGAHYPAMLPGFEAQRAFLFADSLGFHAIAMTADNDPEPKAAVAVLSRLLADGGATPEEWMAPSIGKSAAALLGEEVARYLGLHPDMRRIRVHALRPGDAMPAARALGCALRAVEPTSAEEAGETRSEWEKLAFDLELFPADGRRAMAGRFLSTTAERRRSGAGAVPEEDRWLLDSAPRPGGVSLPRLAWARRATATPETPAHLALAFDIFESRIECVPLAQVPTGALEIHGLALTPERNFFATPRVRWESSIPHTAEGEKHPAARALTDRLLKAHTALLRGVARNSSNSGEGWPVLVTEVSPDRSEMLANLHRLCDWVITVDRHAGIEYFDSPRDLPRLYESYLIDCVPERDDLGFLQLITSTAPLDEIRCLLDTALGEMGLSASPGNCAFLLDALKAVSGRLAMRLAQSGTVAQELVALALVQSHCADANAETGEEPWLSLREGFFVPLDDVPELLRAAGDKKEATDQRADLLYVTAGKRGGLRLTFVEVKFRRYLKTARAPDLTESIAGQLDASCRQWEKLFGAETTMLEKTVQRARLARILRFYARKGRRHTLSLDAFERIEREIAKLTREGTGYSLPELMEQEQACVGFVFCPEFSGVQPAEIDTDIWLFGSAKLPASRTDVYAVTSTVEAGGRPGPHPALQQEPSQPEPATPDGTTPETGTVNADGSGLTVDLLLGRRDGSDEPVLWRLGIRGNPHLMIVGLPGMGKTHCLIGLCRQLVEHGIAPVVFSYHQDIDEKLGTLLGNRLRPISYAGLGFNPLQVTGEGPLAWMDNVSMLRDNFSAIFPDLGDVQLGRVREAVKKSYLDQGWTTAGARGNVPPFGAFFDLLKNEAKPDRGVMTRLAELADYGMFDRTAGTPSLLDEATPTLVQIHGSPNEMLQRAFATFVLHNLYQTMFRRGPQRCITHAIIFDEAHRAARLKLIPTMAKECRKYGLAFVVASQEVRDFDPSLFPAVASYLALRSHEADARQLAHIMAPSDKVKLYADRIKQMAKFKAWFHAEGMTAPVPVVLSA
ncbi:MAG TPA: hypothetical protein PKE44_03240 [Plasticicumulans sp.]|uniref:hypothetical protein n=1 Tax=Plasticicumulans sp. TaxID=2307179 RepID=UPI002BE8D71A|nr:hypothetical protein [Plasticicumulans sp.]HMW28566.1 hypothetical protein [Plasticicumulans sp.]